jgi:DNA-binding transcriptional regulator YhcF (GntR family)
MSQGLTRERPAVKPGTEAARAAFLYGTGDGERVLSVRELVKIGGVEANTIRRHLPAWEKEYLQMVAGESGKGFQLYLSPDDIKTHLRNIQDFKRLDAEIQQEIDELPKAIKHLRGMLDWFKENGSTGDVLEMKVLIESYIRTGLARKTRLKERLEVNARWNKLTGIEDLIDAAGAREKAMQTGRAKLDLELERKAAGLEGNGEPVRPPMPVGRKYKRKDEAIPVETVEDEDDGLGTPG